MPSEVIERLHRLAVQGPFEGSRLTAVGGAQSQIKGDINSSAILVEGSLPCPISINGSNVKYGKYVSGLDGKSSIVFNDQILPLENVELHPVAAEPFLSPEHREQKDLVLKQVQGQSNFFDAPRWSPCAFIVESGKLSILVRESTYLALRAVRGKSLGELGELFSAEDYANFSRLPNLLTVYGTTETSDGYLVFALRDPRKSDQDDVTAKPAGFISMQTGETVKSCLLREFDEELVISRNGKPIPRSSEMIEVNKALHIGNSFQLDRVWDITNHGYLPVGAAHDQISIPLRRIGDEWAGEHKLMIFVPNNLQLISEIIRTGTLKIDGSNFEDWGVPLDSEGLSLKFAGAALASLLCYSNARGNGAVKPTTARTDKRIIASERAVKIDWAEQE